MMTTEQLADEAVERGYTWLTAEGPALGLDVNRVDLSELDIADPYSCVLGQAADDSSSRSGYLRTLEALFSDEDTTVDVMESGQWAKAHGFCADTLNDIQASDLNAAWRRKLIAERAS